MRSRCHVLIRTGRNPTGPTIPDRYVDQIRELADQVSYSLLNEDVPREVLEDVDVIFGNGTLDHFSYLQYAKKLTWIHSFSVGVDNLLTEGVRNSPVIITNSRGCNSAAIAEYTIAAIFSWSKGFHHFARQQEQKVWKRVPVIEVYGSTLGIVGYGAIGKEIAQRAKALGMNVIACRRSTIFDPAEPVDRLVTPEHLAELLSASDFVVNCLPATPENKGFFNDETFAKMKPTSLFINIGRGDTVDEDAIRSALIEKRIAGAFLDVFLQEPLPADHPFWAIENLYITPHNSFASPKNMDRISTLFCDNLRRFIQGEPLVNVIDKAKGC
ncbi:D-2-hydroxyacid dehydrogenase [Brevibacillus nitrificans]|uniref:D-2-hydroxyacid dehydrogenase n=1 Tax=Brevibacillus nitrificans TaxID=651560 RepID=UPI002636C449|nr:D-2-hydroxyacid dehydrogenase [Brevibacillus nitrificans]MED1796707.1 D-2-hydroxyacid dehydrogenase [Brevibacillus nitrificans]